MNENNKNISNDLSLDETTNEKNVEITNEKLETKGLKLKKTTKEKLNLLQNSFDDAETMIATLLVQYEMTKIESDSRFADRKAEIEKFNYFLDSLKNSYLNSLDMATYIEEKYIEKFEKEIKQREEIILATQEENNILKKNINELNALLTDKNIELSETKNNFTQINIALTTLESDSKEKSNVINDLQNHISTLKQLLDEDKAIKIQYTELLKTNEELNYKISDYNHLDKENLQIKEEILDLKDEIKNLKNDIKSEQDYAKDLNEKIQAMLVSNSLEILKINENTSIKIKEIEDFKNTIITKKDEELIELKELVYNLKLKLSSLK